MFAHLNSFTRCMSLISVDLLRAWERSEAKYEGWTQNDAVHALHRYERFLRLVAAHPGVPQAPTRDIDEMWHLHMLSPKAYHDDCMRLFGEVLDHDGGFGKGDGEAPMLQVTFEQTAKMWLAMYGEPYTDTPSSQFTKCWHNCQSRCWHACSSKVTSSLVTT
jgi:hypothetical protein